MFMYNILNRLKEGLLILDLRGEVVFINVALLQMLNYFKYEWLGTTIKTYIDNYEEVYRILREGSYKEMPLTFYTSTGNQKNFICEVEKGTYEEQERLFILAKDSTAYKQSSTILLKNPRVTTLTSRIQGKPIGKPSYAFFEETKKGFNKQIIVEQDLEGFLNITTELMCIINNKGNFLKVTDKWEKVLGWSENELVKMNWYELLHPEDILYLNQLNREGKNQEIKRNIALRYRCKSGEYKWMSWQGQLVMQGQKRLLKATEVEDEKCVDKEINYGQIIRKVELRNEFLTNMSHEFKTPLNIILSGIQLIGTELSDKKRDPIQKEKQNINLGKYTTIIRHNAYRLLRLVNNIIDLTSVDSGCCELHLMRCDIINFVEDITLLVARYVSNKDIELIFDTDVEELMITCDPNKIERIMFNLLSNAIKYRGAKGKIGVTISTTEEEVYISVKDNGIGIPKDKQDKIFENFVQLDKIFVRRTEGSGIGLALVKALVKLHQGHITVESEVGKGSEFVVTLPIKLREDVSCLEVYKNLADNSLERCIIEFSDIYNL